MNVLQRIFQFRTCTLDIKSSDDRWQLVPPVPAAQHPPLHRPVQLPRAREDYRRQIKKLDLRAGRQEGRLIQRDGARDARGQRGPELREGAAASATRSPPFRTSTCAATAKPMCSPRSSRSTRRRAWTGSRRCSGLAKLPRTIEGIDIAHLERQDTVASLVSFLDGLPFKPGYRRFKIKSVEGVDDFASMREVVTRRFRRLNEEDEVFPDILLIDGGKGQLNAALDAFEALGIDPPCLISLAKQEEEIFRPGRNRADQAEPALGGSAAPAIRPRRSPPLRPALPPHAAAEKVDGGLTEE